MRRLLPGLLAGLLLACAGPVRDGLPDVKLPNLADHREYSLASCPTPKCLTVYLAPWCGYCRRATPDIIALRAWLNERGVTTRIVIGKDSPAALRDYAKLFGRDTLLDEEGALAVGGVPNFMVSDPSGRVLRVVPGLPGGISSLEEFAEAFGLP